MATIMKASEMGSNAPGIFHDTCGNYADLKAEGYRYDVHCLDTPHTLPGPLSDYYDGRDWCFKSRAAAERACNRANREAVARGDGLRFVVVDMRA